MTPEARERAEQAVYRALAPHRINAAHRRTLAAATVEYLSDLDADVLPGVVEMGKFSPAIYSLRLKFWPVPVGRRPEAIVDAVAAAAKVLTESPEQAEEGR